MVGLRAQLAGEGGCRGVRALGCLLVGLSGSALVFVPALDGDIAIRVTALSLFLASLAAPLYLVDQRVGVVWLVIAGSGLALALATPELWPFIVAVGFVGSALLALQSLSAALVSLGVTASLAVVAGPGEYKWLVLAAYTLLPAVASLLSTRRIHSLAAIGAAALVIVFAGKPEAVAASTLPVLAFIASTGLMERSMCPFRSDARLVMIGSLLAVAGLLASLGEESVAARGLWAAGLLLLVVGLLVPSTAFQAAAASTNRPSGSEPVASRRLLGRGRMAS